MDENLRKAYEIVERSKEGDISLFNLGIKTLPSNIPKIVNGTFSCSHNLLTSLKNAPKIVNGSFCCSWNKLTSLKYAPKIITDSFFILDTIRNNSYFPPFTKGAIYASLTFSPITNHKRNSLQKEKTQWTKI